jgi:hypothetical protein
VVSANGFPRSLISVFKPESLLFLQSSSSVVLTRLSGPRSRPAASQNNWKRRKSNPRPLDSIYSVKFVTGSDMFENRILEEIFGLGGGVNGY